MVAPIAGGMMFVALVGLLVFLNMARRKRSLHGTYNPQKQVSLMARPREIIQHFQELAAPRFELDYMLKLPAEERLI